MTELKKVGMAVFVYSLVACGDSDLPESDTNVQAYQKPVQQEQEVNTENTKPFIFQGMKKALDKAKGAEDLMQKHHEEQLKGLNN